MVTNNRAGRGSAPPGLSRRAGSSQAAFSICLIKETLMFTRNNHFWMIGLTALGVLMSFAVAVAAYAG
jgi:hypothetical protein